MTTAQVLTGHADRVDRARKYFTETAAFPVEHPMIRPAVFGGGVALLAAVVIGLVGSMQGTFALLVVVLGMFGTVAMIAGGIKHAEYRTLYVASSTSRALTEPKATDQEMDYWLGHDVSGVVGDGLARFALPAAARQQALVFVGPAYSASLVARRGLDLVTRFSSYQVLVAYLRDGRLSTYECQLDMISGNRSQWQTKEYPVSVVDGVETFSGNQRVNFVNEQPFIGSLMYRPRTHVRTPDTQVVRVVVSGRVAVGIEMSIASANQKALGTLSRAQLDAKAAQLRDYLRH